MSPQSGSTPRRTTYTVARVTQWARSRVGAYAIVRSIIGVLLITAACLKAASFTGFVAVAPSWADLLWIEAELLLGIALVCGLWPQVTCFVACAVFSVFAAYSFLHAIGGSESCQCFGDLTLNPWVAFVLDVTAVAGLASLYPRGRTTVLTAHHACG